MDENLNDAAEQALLGSAMEKIMNEEAKKKIADRVDEIEKAVKLGRITNDDIAFLISELRERKQEIIKLCEQVEGIRRVVKGLAGD